MPLGSVSYGVNFMAYECNTCPGSQERERKREREREYICNCNSACHHCAVYMQLAPTLKHEVVKKFYCFSACCNSILLC